MAITQIVAAITTIVLTIKKTHALFRDISGIKGHFTTIPENRFALSTYLAQDGE